MPDSGLDNRSIFALKTIENVEGISAKNLQTVYLREIQTCFLLLVIGATKNRCEKTVEIWMQYSQINIFKEILLIIISETKIES